MKRFAFVVVLALVGALALAAGAATKTSKGTFDLHVGDGFAPPLAAVSVAQASNGDTIEVRITGTFNVRDKTASGSGTFVHKHGATTLASGTIALTRTIAFQFYGCGILPTGGAAPAPSWCGGRVLLGATLISGAVHRDVMIEVNCQVHSSSFSPPPGTSEGIKVNARGINFNKHVSGANLFVMK